MPRYINIAARLDAKLKKELQEDLSWDDIKDAPQKLSDFENDEGFVKTDTTYDNATTSVDGLMSSADKTKLNGIAAGATAFSGDFDDLANKPSIPSAGDVAKGVTAYGWGNHADEGYLKQQDISNKADKSELFSGDFDDLNNKPEGVAVADAVDDSDVVAQLNSLLASLRAAKLIAE